MVMMSIKETAKATKLSQYEVRRRVLNGTCPHTRVGAKGTKILIYFEEFMKLLKEEVYQNMTVTTSIPQDTGDNVGYGYIRKIK